jgi:hypothetical protein
MAGGMTKASAMTVIRNPLTVRGTIALLLGYHTDVWDERMMADLAFSFGGQRRGADQVILIGARHGLAADRSLQRLPEDPVRADRRECVRD